MCSLHLSLCWRPYTEHHLPCGAATGLYYIAELVEECSQLAKRVITWAVEARLSDTHPGCMHRILAALPSPAPGGGRGGRGPSSCHARSLASPSRTRGAAIVLNCRLLRGTRAMECSCERRRGLLHSGFRLGIQRWGLCPARPMRRVREAADLDACSLPLAGDASAPPAAVAARQTAAAVHPSGGSGAAVILAAAAHLPLLSHRFSGNSSSSRHVSAERSQ